MKEAMSPKQVLQMIEKKEGKRKLYRIRLTVGSHNYVVGWGTSIKEVIEAFKREVDGYCFQQLFDRVQEKARSQMYEATPVQVYGTQEKVGRAIERQKEFLRENGSLNFEVFDQEYDADREEWMNKNQEYWAPKYDVKF